MGPLPDPAHEAFALGWVAYGGNGRLAYAHAYGVPLADVSPVDALALRNSPHVAARIRKLVESTSDTILLTKEAIAMEYAEIRELAKACQDFRSAITAQDRVATMAGEIMQEIGKRQDPASQPGPSVMILNMPPPALTLQDWMNAQGVKAPVVQQVAIDVKSERIPE